MNFVTELRALYNLHRNGSLDALLRASDELLRANGEIRNKLGALERAFDITKARLAKVQDNVVRKSLNLAMDVDVGQQHVSFETAYRVVMAGCSPFLVGPAGSGKSTILSQVAAAMKLPFYPMSVNALTSDYNIIGYNDANGRYVPTVFRQAYENGGIFSFEEIDAGNPNVLTVINNAMSQDTYAFPDNIVKKHPQFIMAASGNTYGIGGNLQYVGRNPLDAATLDRFVVVRTDYDTNLEYRLCTNVEWLNYVHAVRRVVNEYQMKLVVGTRAVINGDRLLNVGLPREAVEEMVIFKGLPAADVEKIRGNVKTR